MSLPYMLTWSWMLNFCRFPVQSSPPWAIYVGKSYDPLGIIFGKSYTPLGIIFVTTPWGCRGGGTVTPRILELTETLTTICRL